MMGHSLFFIQHIVIKFVYCDRHSTRVEYKNNYVIPPLGSAGQKEWQKWWPDSIEYCVS